MTKTNTKTKTIDDQEIVETFALLEIEKWARIHAAALVQTGRTPAELEALAVEDPEAAAIAHTHEMSASELDLTMALAAVFRRIAWAERQREGRPANVVPFR